ncbi:hypothetical protein F5Y19DRAFT_236329 [Xylariaceae sp. FL1651]|nr:hypothetical protein F5Y19DRAFT_236329 [Xylariaceae sp. FL1651]
MSSTSTSKGPLENRDANATDIGVIHAGKNNTCIAHGLDSHNSSHPTGENAVSKPQKRKSDAVNDQQDVPEIDDNDSRPNNPDAAHAVDSTQDTQSSEKRELQSSNSASPPKAKKAKTSKKVNSSLDVSGIHLPGEETRQVPIFETCDEVRRKIRALLRSKDVSQAALCRTIAAECLPKDGKLQSRQMTAFLEKHGVMSGNTSTAFYGSYVFFEKRRLKEGKPKSKFREEMERLHPNGVDTEADDRYLTCREDERPVIDKYGVLSFEKIGGMPKW